MPREPALFDHYGVHRVRTTVRYPLARFCSLLAIGASTLVAYRFGPFTTSEMAMATEMLGSVGPGDLVLADRNFAGSPMLARLQAGGADFLMRKNARLIVYPLPVVRRLGHDDFLVDLPVSKPARHKDPTLPETARIRIFRATWTAPSGKVLTEWFVTSLLDPRRFKKRTLARLYHERWRAETSYMEFKQTFHADVLRSKTVENVEKEFAKQFKPDGFDAEEWVQTIKDAGMKYIVITAKHHDGFAMYHSDVSKWDIDEASPNFKRDPIDELAKACKKHAIKLGL